METDIKLNFINDSGRSAPNVVFFQKNVATDFDEVAIAWKVITDCSTGWHQEFVFPLEMFIGASDSWGNEIIQPIKASYGQLFHVHDTPSGMSLSYIGPAPSEKEVHLRNKLQKDSINANIYKDGKLLATNPDISPEQNAVFQFKPTLWIGVVSQVQEGQIMNSAILSDINTELGLLGVASADIVMTGGGFKPHPTDYNFILENIVYV